MQTAEIFGFPHDKSWSVKTVCCIFMPMVNRLGEAHLGHNGVLRKKEYIF